MPDQKYLYGSTTKEFVEIFNVSPTSTLSASVSVRDMSKPFIRDEKLTLLSTDDKGNFTGTSSTGDYTVVNTFYDDTSLQINKLDWRTTHKLVVDFGGDNNTIPPHLMAVRPEVREVTVSSPQLITLIQWTKTLVLSVREL